MGGVDDNQTRPDTLALRPAASAVLRARRPGLEPLVPWLIAAIAMAGLYFGKSILIPIILAGLVSFLLAPIVGLLRRIGLPRPPAVIVTVLLAFAVFGLLGSAIVGQVATLGKDAPAYAERITDKAQRVRAEVVDRFAFLNRDRSMSAGGKRIAEDARRRGRKDMPPQTVDGALPVQVQEAPPTAMDELRTFVLPVLAPLETTLIVLIVTIFILFQKEDLRDRAIRLMGAADLHRSTVALDDSAKRLSRYFLAQFAINSSFGAVIWGSLFLLGIPAAGLWGMLAALLRFVPYVGSILAAVGPLALAAAIGPDWGLVIYVGLLFVILEPLIGYVVEPLLYGHSTGLSPVSVVIAALFWTWIWGPVGLVLSVPLTLTLVVFGRHIPAFGVFDILLGDRPVLSPAETFYQRILTGHHDDIVDQAERLLETSPLVEYYDEVVLGVLRHAAADVDRGAVPRAAMKDVSDGIIEIVAALNVDFGPGAGEPGPDLGGRSIVCIAGRGPLDAAVNAITAQLLRHAGATVVERSRDPLPGATGAAFDPGDADTICFLGLFDQRGEARIQPISQRMRDRFPGVAILIGIDREAGGASPVQVDADSVAGSGRFATISALVAAIAAADVTRDRVDQTATGAAIAGWGS